MLWFCGFNGFKQFNFMLENIQEEFQDNEQFIPRFLKINGQPCVLDIHLTWSNALTIRDKSAILSGFVNGKPGESVSLETPDKQAIIQGTCNNKNCLLVTNQGKCWNYCLDSQLWKEMNYCCAPDQNLVKTVLGEIISAALTNKGTVWNIGSQLSSPEMVVIDIACGKEHGILLTNNGDIYTWGGGSRGQLGNGTLESNEEICEVPLLAGMNVVKIAAGGWHNAVITKDGDIYTWGWNKQGQLGHPTLDGKNKDGVAVLTEPKAIDWPNSLEVFVKDVSCGASHTVVLLGNGEIWGCGWNKWGQLGSRAFKYTHLMTKLNISPLRPITKVVCDAWNTVLISEDD